MANKGRILAFLLMATAALVCASQWRILLPLNYGLVDTAEFSQSALLGFEFKFLSTAEKKRLGFLPGPEFRLPECYRCQRGHHRGSDYGCTSTVWVRDYVDGELIAHKTEHDESCVEVKCLCPCQE